MPANAGTNRCPVAAGRCADVAGAAPMTSVVEMNLKAREDVVSDAGDAEAILKNAPSSAHGFFVVPKVVG